MANHALIFLADNLWLLICELEAAFYAVILIIIFLLGRDILRLIYTQESASDSHSMNWTAAFQLSNSLTVRSANCRGSHSSGVFVYMIIFNHSNRSVYYCSNDHVIKQVCHKSDCIDPYCVANRMIVFQILICHCNHKQRATNDLQEALDQETNDLGHDEASVLLGIAVLLPFVHS